MPGTAPSQFQFQQNGKHGLRRGAAAPDLADQVIHGHGCRPQRFFHLRANAVGLFCYNVY